MFSTLKQRLILGIYIFIILSIPVGAYLASQFQTLKSSASEQKTKKQIITQTPPPLASSSATKNVKLLGETLSEIASSPKPASSPSTDQTVNTTIASSFGPTLSLKTKLEGRPQNDQSSKMFLGIAEGIVTTNPKFVLNYTLNIPASGEYTNISLAGLTVGNQYTAILKGPTQIATSSAFIMSPNVTNLNNGEPLTLLTGDLNEDNIINSSDYSIAQKALGSNSSSSNWNQNADFNKDGVVNSLDLAFIVKNFGRAGASGPWYSTVSKAATASASLKTSSPIGGPPNQSDGYWLWVPK